MPNTKVFKKMVPAKGGVIKRKSLLAGLPSAGFLFVVSSGFSNKSTAKVIKNFNIPNIKHIC